MTERRVHPSKKSVISGVVRDTPKKKKKKKKSPFLSTSLEKKGSALHTSDYEMTRNAELVHRRPKGNSSEVTTARSAEKHIRGTGRIGKGKYVGAGRKNIRTVKKATLPRAAVGIPDGERAIMIAALMQNNANLLQTTVCNNHCDDVEDANDSSANARSSDLLWLLCTNEK